MSRPLFSVVVPTIGRPSLARTLASIPSGVEVIVVADAHEATVETIANIEAVAGAYGCRYLEHDVGRHDRGDSQIALGFRRATGRWLLNCGDDDVYEPDAFEAMARAIREQDGGAHPLMFRVELRANPVRGPRPAVLWAERGVIERGGVTGQSFACPNDPARLGIWETDWYFMQTTVANYGGRCDWRDELIMRCD